MTPEIRPGDIVDITIKGARVKEICYHGDDNGPDLRFTYKTKFGEAHDAVWVDAPGVTVEHVAPAEWPPQPGDLWRDRHGGLWFAADVRDIEETDVAEIVMVWTYENYRVTPDVLARRERLTLVHREQTGADAPQDGGQ